MSLSERALTPVDDFARPRSRAIPIPLRLVRVQEMTNVDIIGDREVVRGGCHQA
jgi:hypothetical protein